MGGTPLSCKQKKAQAKRKGLKALSGWLVYSMSSSVQQMERPAQQMEKRTRVMLMRYIRLQGSRVAGYWVVYSEPIAHTLAKKVMAMREMIMSFMVTRVIGFLWL